MGHPAIRADPTGRRRVLWGAFPGRRATRSGLGYSPSLPTGERGAYALWSPTLESKDDSRMGHPADPTGLAVYWLGFPRIPRAEVRSILG